jgi:predicted dienelactone hydrolase
MFTRDADVSRQARSYPVVIMRAGASAGVVGYSTLAEDLASHGYIIVGFDAPHRTNSARKSRCLSRPRV